MKKILILLFAIYLFGFDIKNIIDENTYNSNKSLIDILFKNKNLSIKESLKILRENGLLNLQFNKPKKLYITFLVNNNYIKSIKYINNSLKFLGYYYYFISSMKYENNNLSYTITLKVEKNINPFLLVNELENKKFNILDIKRLNETNWVYNLDAKNIDEKILTINKNEKKYFTKPIQDYFFKINEIGILNIISYKLNSWHPYIVFFDKNFNILKIIKKQNKYKKLKINIPNNTKYIKISDTFSLINIKRGLIITIK